MDSTHVVRRIRELLAQLGANEPYNTATPMGELAYLTARLDDLMTNGCYTPDQWITRRSERSR